MRYLRTAAASASRSWITIAGFILGLDLVGYVQTTQTLLTHWKPLLALIIGSVLKGAAKGAWEAIKALYIRKDAY